MASDRLATVRRVLTWLAMLPQGLAWKEKWRAEFAAELERLESGEERAA